jgi:uncharacterized membrane protein
MKAETEIWQVLTHEGVFQADLPTLKQWVSEGHVHTTDRVRKGTLKWIEAGRAPGLRRVFSGEEQVVVEELASVPDATAQAQPHTQGQPLPAEPAYAMEVVSAQPPASGQFHPSPDLSFGRGEDPARSGVEAEGFHGAAPAAWTGPVLSGTPSLGSSCHFHPTQAATLVCRACSATFCRSCPNQMGVSSVLLCTLCGGFCDPLEKLTERLALYARQGSGFGFGDFGQSLAYPFKHLASLLGGALLYGFLLMAGLRGQLLAWALVFGCISLVIRRVGYGRLDRDFLPDFSEFSFWDDVIVPCALGLGVTIVTLGPVLLLLVALLFGWFGGTHQTPPFALAPPPAAPQQQQQQSVKREDADSLAKDEVARQEEVVKKVEEIGRQAQEASRLEQSKASDNTALTVVRQLLAHPGLVLLLGLASLVWAVFYHPMALLVAGWTESFKSVINPLVGLDTMRHMGLTYFKAFLMYLAVQLVGLVLTFLVALVTSPFDMPFVGNLPGKFIGGIVTFYTSLVIACVLGLALFKSADRLGIELE